MSTFAEATTWTDNTLTCTSDWAQGRSTFGGVPAAAALGLLRQHVPADRPVRSVSIVFLGPVSPGTATGEAAILRAGKNMTFGEATITQDGSPRLRLSGAFGADRPSKAVVAGPTVPARPDPKSLPNLPYIEGITPKFTQHIDFRWTDGGFPFTGSKESGFAGYVRHRTAVADVEGAVLGLIDAWPCSVLPILRAPAPASSVTWTAHLMDLPAEMTDEYWFFEQEVVVAQQGYVTCVGRLYRPDGPLAAWSEQLVAVFD